MRVGKDRDVQSVLKTGAYAYAKVPSDDTVWSWHPRITPPVQLKMGSLAGSDMISEHTSLFVKQTRRGWFRELLGYEAMSEFNIAALQNRDVNIMYAREDSSMWARLFCLNLHQWDMTVWHGDSPGGVKLAEYHRPWRCIPGPMKCCCHQQIQHRDTNGEYIGLTEEDFYCCVPKFNVKDSLDNVEFIISKPSCCDGMLVNCFSEGVFSCRIPFYVYPAGCRHQVSGAQVGKIVKVWGGVKELYTDVDNVEVTFPSDTNSASKVRILGSLFLINQLYFEHGLPKHNLHR